MLHLFANATNTALKILCDIPNILSYLWLCNSSGIFGKIAFFLFANQ